MALMALEVGDRAPEFTLPTVDGQQVSLAKTLHKGPVVLAFFKVSCPVCQYSFPFLERLYQANLKSNVTFLGVSQDDAKKTQAFMQEFGVRFPVALDDPTQYTVSNAYGLTNVPTIYYIDRNGGVEIAAVGWSKADVEAIHSKLAALRQSPPASLWRPGEDIRDFRAG